MSTSKTSTSKPRGRTPRNQPTNRRSYTPFIVLAVIAVVAIGIGVLMAGEDEDSGSGTALATAGVTVRGDALPPLPEGGGADPATGTAAPTLEGVAPDGTPTSVEFEEPTLLAFLAHWCPHCQAELPNLVALADNGAFDDLDAVVVLTGTDEAAPNYPPADWLEREGWDGRVLVDDADQPAASAFGLTSYPYLVLVDGDGEVIARSAGELGMERLLAFVEQAA